MNWESLILALVAVITIGSIASCNAYTNKVYNECVMTAPVESAQYCKIKH